MKPGYLTMASGRKFVIGDIHGAHKALRQCFEKADFNYENDMLICLGDVCDGWPEVDKVIDELLTVKNLVYVLGNHDFWALDWFKYGTIDTAWLDQGGKATILSYRDNDKRKPIQFFKDAKYYYLEDNKLFIHGGFDPLKKIKNQDKETFLWDRNLAYIAFRCFESGNNQKLTNYSEVYLGHTPTIKFGYTEPFRACGIWFMDTGAGWPSGKLSMMDINSGQIYMSSRVNLLYPEFNPRG